MKRILPILAIIVLWVLFSSPYFFKGLVPFPSRFLVTFFAPWSASFGMPVKNNAMPDVITQIYPWKQLTVDAWKEGSIPLWNPYSFGGTHLAANYQSGVFFPFNFIFLILPFIDAWSIFILLQPLLAGFFMLLFLKELKVSMWGAVVGAIAFSYSSYMTTWMAYGTIGYAILFLPLILWGITAHFSDRPWWYSLAIPIGICASLTAGHLQMSLYVMITAVLFTLGFFYHTKDRWKTLVILCLMGAGILLAAPQILLGFEAFQLSNRGQFVKAQELIPWHYFMSFIAPDYFGNPVTRNDWFGHYAEWGGFAGTVTFLLACSSVFLAKRKMKTFFMLLFFFVVLFAYDTPFSHAIYALKIPLFSTSAASRFISMGAFSLAVLASFGFDALFVTVQVKKKKRLFILCLGFMIPFIIMLGMAFAKVGLTADASVIAVRNSILPILLALGTVAGIIASFFLPRKFRIGIGIVVLTILAYDLYRFSAKWMPFDERQFVYPPVKMSAFLKERIGNDRVFGNLGGEYVISNKFPVIEGYDAMYIGRFGEFIESASRGILTDGERSVVTIDKHGLYTPKVFQLMGIRYIIQRISDGRNSWAFPFWEYGDRMKSIYKDEHYELFEYEDALPRAYFTSSYEVISGDENIIDTLFSPEMNSASTVILEKKPSIDPAFGDGTVSITDYRSNSVRINTASETPKILVLSDSWAPGWKVTVDGNDEEVLRANFIFRAVAVPEGSHEVIFYYQPFGVSVGLVISGITAGTLILATCIAIRTKKGKKQRI